MLGQNYVMELLAKAGGAQQQAFDLKKSGDPDKAGFPQFKDILSGSMNKTQQKASVTEKSSVQKRTNQKDADEKRADPDSGSKTQFRSYKEVRNAAGQDGNAGKVQNKPSAADSKAEIKSEDANKAKTKEDIVVEGLAQALGVSTEDIMKLLKIADIKPEELADQSSMGKAIGKLAQIMDLNTGQKEALSEVMETLKAAADKYPVKDPAPKAEVADDNSRKAQKASSEDGNEKEGWVKLDHANISVADNRKPLQKFQEVMSEMKVKLQEIADKMEKNPEAAKADILESIKASISKIVEGSRDNEDIDGNNQSKIKIGDAVVDDPDKSLKAGDESKQESSADSKGRENDETDAFIDTKEAPAQPVKVESVQTDNENNVSFNKLVESAAQKADVHEAVKVSKETPVPKTQIIEQVVQKAKVVLTAEKSEMVMDLKPESLGKLSLKVVTEHGMVIAKFVAESQQVKEALEANMQLLKDSLEKQGLSVQGFSVSVGQDSNRGMNGNGRFENGKSGEKIRPAAVNGGAYASHEQDSERMQEVNPYAWSGSRINLTA